MELPMRSEVVGWKMRDWSAWLQANGWEFVRNGKHGNRYRHPRHGYFQLSGSPGDTHVNDQRWRQLRYLTGK